MGLSLSLGFSLSAKRPPFSTLLTAYASCMSFSSMKGAPTAVICVKNKSRAPPIGISLYIEHDATNCQIVFFFYRKPTYTLKQVLATESAVSRYRWFPRTISASPQRFKLHEGCQSVIDTLALYCSFL